MPSWSSPRALVGAWLLVLEPSSPPARSTPTSRASRSLRSATKPPRPPPKPRSRGRPRCRTKSRCWEEFGGGSAAVARPRPIQLGKPTRPIWARAMGSYMEYPPSYCDGTLYVNTFRGRTAAFDARPASSSGRGRDGGAKHSTPAIAGPRLIVLVEERQPEGARPRDGRATVAAATSARRSSRRRSRSTNTVVLRGDRRPAVRRQRAHRARSAGPTTPAVASTPARRSGATASASRRTPARCSASTGATARSSGASTSTAASSATRASTRARPPTARRIFLVSRSGKVYAVNARDGDRSGADASARPATRRRRSPPGACSSAASTARCAPTAPRTATSSGGGT